MNCHQAKEVNIHEYLERKGIAPIKKSAKGLWYHSPMSADRNPSLEVSHDGKMFKDWSAGHHGTIIDLSIMMGAVDVCAALADIQQTMNVSTLNTIGNMANIPKHKERISMRIVDVRDVADRRLFGYAFGRGKISREIVSEFCSEVTYVNSGRVFYALGFRNDKGGFELRSRVFKGSVAPKAITTINDLVNCPYLVFEGFFDMMSAVKLGLFRPDEMNALVLNSTAMVDQGIEVLANASEIVCMLDNDDAGRKATARITEAYPFAQDKSFLFLPANDINEYLCLMNNSKIKPLR